MAATQDTSVLFSLNQLQNLHEARLREEEREARERAEAARIAQEEQARREAEAAAQRTREEAARQAAEEAAKREEEAKLEAMQLAAVERARAEVEASARMEMMRKADEHEKALVALREDQRHKRMKRTLQACLFGAATLIVGAGLIYFGKIKPENEARLMNQSAEINAQQEEAARIRAKLDANEKRIADAAAQVAEAKRKASELAEKRVTEEPATNHVGSRPPSSHKPVEKPKTGGPCLPGEPGCDLNGNRLF